jgi:Flp pilus assembly protein CpaB
MNNPQPFGNQGSFGMGSFGTPPGVGEPLPQNDSRQERKARQSKRSGKSDSPKAPTKRLMSRQRLFAVVLAAIAGLLVLTSTSGSSSGAFVARLTTTLPALSTLEDSQWEIISLPDNAIEEGAFTADSKDGVQALLAAHSSGRVRGALAKGHQLRESDFSADAELATPLAQDERLVAVEAAVMSAVGGQLRAGDHVDVIAVVDIEGTTIANLVATDIEIIAALPGSQQFNSVAQEQVSGSNKGRTGNELLPSDPVPGIYNVRVSTTEAVILAAASSRGNLVLVLRGKGSADLPVAPVNLDQVMTQIISPQAVLPQSLPTATTVAPSEVAGS